MQKTLWHTVGIFKTTSEDANPTHGGWKLQSCCRSWHCGQIFENVSCSSLSIAIYGNLFGGNLRAIEDNFKATMSPCPHCVYLVPSGSSLLIFPALYHDRSRLDDVEPWLLEWPLNLGSNPSSLWQVSIMREEVAVKMTKKSGKVKEHRNLKCKSVALDFTWSNLQTPCYADRPWSYF